MTVKVYLPKSIYQIFLLFAKYDPYNEFLIYSSFVETDNKKELIILGDETEIPEQIVTPVSVQVLKQELPHHNVVMHLHPPGVTSFSGTDWTFLHVGSIKLSILFVREGDGIRLTQCVHKHNEDWGPCEVTVYDDSVEVNPEQLVSEFREKVKPGGYVHRGVSRDDRYSFRFI
jgi:hypothetical protein